MRILILVAILIPFLSISQQPTKEQIRQVEQAKKEVKKMKGEKFPDFELTTLDGKTVSSKELNDKYILFNFWFTSCGPCIQEMPELNELVEEFANEDVVFFRNMKIYNGADCNADLQADLSRSQNLDPEQLIDETSFGSNLRIMPNPARGDVKFQFKSATGGQGTLTIYNIMEQAVLKRPLSIENGINDVFVDVSGSPPGVYVAEVKFGEDRWAGKIEIIP